MSRGHAERRTAWEVWDHFHTIDHMGRPYAFEHQCGSLTPLPGQPVDFGDISCSGCHFQIDYPETECSPLYAARSPV